MLYCANVEYILLYHSLMSLILRPLLICNSCSFVYMMQVYIWGKKGWLKKINNCPYTSITNHRFENLSEVVEQLLKLEKQRTLPHFLLM